MSAKLISDPGGGGGTQVQRGAAHSLRISRKNRSFFKMSAILQKKGTFL